LKAEEIRFDRPDYLGGRGNSCTVVLESRQNRRTIEAARQADIALVDSVVKSIRFPRAANCLDAGKGEFGMSMIQSNSDALLIAIPMVGLLFAGFFRLDELFGKPKKQPSESRRRMSGWDKDGQPVCADPDGRMPGSRRGSK
jgi:hypothetical protein